MLSRAGHYRSRWQLREPVGVELGTLAVVGGALLWLGFRAGGYFPVTWNVATVALLAVVAALLLTRRHFAFGPLDAALLLGWVALLSWTWLSVIWSIAPADSVLEGERTLMYLASGAAVLVVASRRGPRTVAIAILAATTIICVSALVSRLVEVTPLPYQRLGGPVEYWNALGILAASGICLALAMAAHERGRLARAAAGASLPVLVCALYLTFSRGSWVALALGLVTLTAVDLDRRALVASGAALVLPCAVVIAAAATAHALVTPNARTAATAADAHRLAAVVLAMCCVAAGLAVRVPRFAVSLPKVSDARIVRFGLAGIACALIVFVVVAGGGPGPVAGRAIRAFDAAPPATSSGLNDRLASFSGSGRGEYWRVAVVTFASGPFVGHGAGTYGRLWLMKRHDTLNVQDAHSLYLETMTELGLVGLMFLLAVLAVPLYAAGRARAVAYVPALTATFIAIAAHAGIDWDWEMPVVTVTLVACGAALVAAARGEPAPLRRGKRVGGLFVVLFLVGSGLVFLIGNRDLDAASTVASTNNATALRSAAAAARRWVPWSPDPLHWLASLDLAHGDRRNARRLLSAAISKDSTDWSLWVAMAAASEGRARTTALSKAHRLDPRGTDVMQAAAQYGLPTPDPQIGRG